MHGGRANPEIFRAYDIRGVYGEDYDDAFAQRLGARVASYLKAKTLVVGRDLRASSDELAYAVIDGAMHAGTSVVDVGELSSPQFYWAIRAAGAQGGIMVTASHNPAKYNGFKVIGRDGEVIGGHHLRQVYDTHPHTHRPDGAVTYRDVVPDYADAVAYASRWQGGDALQVAVDAPPSVLRVLERLGPIAPGGGLAVKMDPDADRIQFFADGYPVPADFIFLLLAERFRLAPVVFDLRFSRVVRERLDAAKIRYRVSRVGRLYLSSVMRDLGAALGGEMSGHFYWREFGGMESPELTLVKFLQATEQDLTKLRNILAPYRRYAKSEELSILVHDRKRAVTAMEHLQKRFHGCATDRADGITVDCWDGGGSVSAADGFWFNVRPSNTEPLLRVVVESKKEDLLDRRVQEVRGLIS